MENTMTKLSSQSIQMKNMEVSSRSHLIAAKCSVRVNLSLAIDLAILRDLLPQERHQMERIASIESDKVVGDCMNSYRVSVIKCKKIAHSYFNLITQKNRTRHTPKSGT